jgi:hypothetical protein
MSSNNGIDGSYNCQLWGQCPNSTKSQRLHRIECTGISERVRVEWSLCARSKFVPSTYRVYKYNVTDTPNELHVTKVFAYGNSPETITAVFYCSWNSTHVETLARSNRGF